MVKEIIVKSALHYHKRRMPTNWDLNIYRGCQHNCTYCFAQYSHRYLDSVNFFNEIFVKKNIVEQFEKELKIDRCGQDLINIGGVTDSYQLIEKEYKIMPKILKLALKYRNPILITTKSNLILRDIKLITELAKVTDVFISTSVSTMNEDIRKKIEPNTTPTKERMQMLSLFKEVGCKTTVLLMPVLPYITDDYQNLSLIFSHVKEAKVDYLNIAPLNLRGNTKNIFLMFLKKEYPFLIERYKSLYKKSFVSKDYNISLRKKCSFLRKKYNLFNSYIPKSYKKNLQLELFES